MEARSLVEIITSATENFSKYKSQMESGNAEEAARTLDELGKNIEELERYKELLDRKQADILEDLITNLSGASNEKVVGDQSTENRDNSGGN